MSLIKKEQKRRERRIARVRSRLENRNNAVRISVFRSLNHISAQVIDDIQGKTLASATSLMLKEAKGDKKEIAFLVGKALAEQIKGLSVQKLVFDRGRFLYHGRVKALADGLRQGGVQI